MPRHVRKGDTVMVTSGNARGQTGVISRVLTGRDRVIVQGVNLRTKHLRPTQQNPQGGTVQREAPLHLSNVSPVVDGKPTRVRFDVKPDGSKVRVAVRNGRTLGTVRGPKEPGRAPSGGEASTSTAAPAKKKSSTSKKKKKPSSKKAGKKKTTAKKKSSRKKGASKKKSGA